MTPRNKAIFLTAVVMAVLAVAIATICNKRWWGRRITAKWDVVTLGAPENHPWTIYGPDFKMWTLLQLFDAWKNGVPGWYLKGERPEEKTGAEFLPDEAGK